MAKDIDKGLDGMIDARILACRERRLKQRVSGVMESERERARTRAFDKTFRPKRKRRLQERGGSGIYSKGSRFLLMLLRSQSRML
jgi:hypothetical protein